MGRWVEYFEKVENDKGYYVRKVPAWVKAVHLINWDFENLNETHRVSLLFDHCAHLEHAVPILPFPPRADKPAP